MSPKKGKTGRGLSKSFQQPYDVIHICIPFVLNTYWLFMCATASTVILCLEQLFTHKVRVGSVAEGGFTDRIVCGSKPTSAFRLPLSRLRQPGSIPALVLPSSGVAAKHRKLATAERINNFHFGCATGTSTEERVQHQKLLWLRHVLRMPDHRLPKRVLFSVPNSEWRKQRGGQPLTWKRGMKEITKRLGAVGATRLPGWGPRDLHCAWLETLKDMAAN
ncbi:hypothetical protein CSKR_106970 [Clonorchis sinensis]|uniref:Uncharacterized protein n=1 Tax=Clonorchis sinensis TaxID=79923 RepID=A0A419Q688_CLOSI|nr:hypothetical protein CSKR_106970 [Clonorchis sinensis]